MVLKATENYIISENNDFDLYKNVESKLVCGNPIKKLVTIVIPTYDRNNLLRESIKSALQQNYEDFSVIVVSNNPNSTNNMKEIFTEFKDARLSIYVNEKNIGLAGNWNRCYQLSQSEWVLQLHDDDYLEKDFLKNMMGTISKKKKIDMLCTSREIVGIRKESNKTNDCIRFLKKKFISITGPIIFKLNAEDYLSILPGSIIGAVIRREKVIELGGFPEKYYPALDKYFLTKFCYAYEAYCVHFKRNLINYRRECNLSLKSDIKRILVLQNKELADFIIEVYHCGKTSKYIVMSNLVNQSIGLKKNSEVEYRKLLSELDGEEAKQVISNKKIRKFITLYSVLLIGFNKLKNKVVKSK
ncbi:MAG: glycosyltransferase family A protein [Anaerorhabdus sp.]|uniref:glycosyltransferase family 2 protein n=1 Tax=Anaerorhabdus sp. TaxID=1872524 RepID=UPI002FCA2A17